WMGHLVGVREIILCESAVEVGRTPEPKWFISRDEEIEVQGADHDIEDHEHCDREPQAAPSLRFITVHARRLPCSSRNAMQRVDWRCSDNGAGWPGVAQEKNREGDGAFPVSFTTI